MPFTHEGVEEEFQTVTQYFSSDAIERIEAETLLSFPPGHFESPPDDANALPEWAEEYLKEYTEDLVFEDKSSELVDDDSSITREDWPSGFSVLSATENEKNRVRDIWPLASESQSGLSEFISEPD